MNRLKERDDRFVPFCTIVVVLHDVGGDVGSETRAGHPHILYSRFGYE